MSAPAGAAAGRTNRTARGVFVAGTDTGVGKTRVTVALLRALQRRGVTAAGMKPVAAGGLGDDDDTTLIRSASAADAVAEAADVNPYHFDWPVSPHLAARASGVVIDPQRIRAAYERLAQRCDWVVVEGTGGWLAPIGERRTMADVAVALALPVVLVIGLRLGCLNHALLTAAAVERSGLPLAGWIGSIIDPGMAALDENVTTLGERLPAPRLALLPYSADRSRDGEQAAAAAAALFA